MIPGKPSEEVRNSSLIPFKPHLPIISSLLPHCPPPHQLLQDPYLIPSNTHPPIPNPIYALTSTPSDPQPCTLFGLRKCRASLPRCSLLPSITSQLFCVSLLLFRMLLPNYSSSFPSSEALHPSLLFSLSTSLSPTWPSISFRLQATLAVNPLPTRFSKPRSFPTSPLSLSTSSRLLFSQPPTKTTALFPSAFSFIYFLIPLSYWSSLTLSLYISLSPLSLSLSFESLCLIAPVWEPIDQDRKSVV